jgi:hypothetical protein
MRWLFAVFLVSLCALLWTAISVARHIRRDRHLLKAGTPARAEQDPPHNFAAGDQEQ